MQEDNNLLDQYLRGKVADADFDFKEEYWARAVQMLDEDDRNKKRPVFWRWFAVLGTLLVVTVGALIFSNKNNNNTKDKSSVAKTETSQPAQQREKSYVSDNPNPVQNQAAENQQVNGSDNISAEKNNVSAQDNGNNVNNKKEPAQPQAANNSPAPSDNNVKDNQQTAQNNNATPKETLATQNIPVKAGNTGKPGNKKGNQQAPEKKPEGAKNNPGNNQVANNNPLQANPGKWHPIDTQVKAPRTLLAPEFTNPRLIPSLQDYIAIKDTTIITYKKDDPVVKADVPAAQIVKDTAAKKKKSLAFFVSGGANLNRGFKGNTNTSIAWGIAPYLNVGIEKAISPKIEIASQIGFTYFNALNVEKKVQQYKYSFGLDSTLISVNYHKMYQIVLPVSIAYHLNKLHTLWGSVGLSYVLNTASLVNTNGQTSYQTGYKDGINPWDLFAQLGYQYELNKKFGIMAMFQQGFMNATQKDYFNITTQNTQTRISLGLKYYFKRNGQ